MSELASLMNIDIHSYNKPDNPDNPNNSLSLSLYIYIYICIQGADVEAVVHITLITLILE